MNGKEFLWQLTIDEYRELMQDFLFTKAAPTTVQEDFSGEKYVFGISGIATLFRCSKTTASKIKPIWVLPTLVCTVKYMEKTTAGGLRQPVFKGLREDKRADECVEG